MAQVKIDKESLQKPEFWMVVVPLVLGLWAMLSLFSVYAKSSRAEVKIKNIKRVEQDAKLIKESQEKLGGVTGQNAIKEFQGLDSANQWAKNERLKESSMPRVESPTPKINKSDGTIINRETYVFSKIRLLQLVKFVDFVESNYSNTSCTNIVINYVRTKSKDSWDARVNLEYTVQP